MKDEQELESINFSVDVIPYTEPGTLTKEVVKKALDELWDKKVQEPGYFECSAEEAPIIMDWIEHPEHFKEVLDELSR